MSPTVPPESGDIDVWSQVVKLGQQCLLSFLQQVQLYGMPMALAVGAAYVLGMDKGLTGRKLRLQVAGSFIVAYTGTPLVIYKLGLAPSVWAAGVAVFLSWLSWRALKWVEWLIMRDLGLERRRKAEE